MSGGQDWAASLIANSAEDCPELVYIACPYTHDDPAVMRARVEAVNRYCVSLVQQGIVFYSPLTHTHQLAELGAGRDWQAWERFDRVFLTLCDRMIIYCLDGWKESKGVAAELAIMRQQNKRVTFVYP